MVKYYMLLLYYKNSVCFMNECLKCGQSIGRDINACKCIYVKYY